MKRKILSVVILSVMVITLTVGVAALATTADENVAYSYGFEERAGYFGNGADNVSEQEVEVQIKPHTGDKFLTLPRNNSYYVLSFVPEEGGDDANYMLSFYAKTSVGQSLFVETVPLVKVGDEEYSWATYRKENNLRYIDDGEGKTQLVTGRTMENGSDWLENRLEFRVPKGCNLVKIYFNTNFAKTPALNSTYSAYTNAADAYRAVDTITIKKTGLNYLRNGNFDCIGYKGDGTLSMPHAAWSAEYAEVKKDSNNNAYLYWNQPEQTGDYGRAQQRVYLYKGEYLLSMDVSMKNSRGTQIVNFFENDALVGTSSLRDNTTLALIKAGTQGIEKTYSYSTYFTVTVDGEYVLKMGSRYYPGEFTFDNIKIVPIEYANLQFGDINHSVTDEKALEEGGGDFHFEYTPAKNPEAGAKVRAFGHAGVNSKTGKAQVITAVYKVDANGQKTLSDVTIDTAEKGKLFQSAEVSIPQTAEEESILLQSMILDSIDTLKVLGNQFISR